MAVKARLLPLRSVAVTLVEAPAVPVAVEPQAAAVALVLVVERQAAVALVLAVVERQAAVALGPVAVELPVVARFPSEQWSKGVPVAAA